MPDFYSPDRILEALNLLDELDNVAEVSRRCKIPRTTIKEWRNDPEMRNRLTKMSRLQALDNQLQERNIDPREVVIKGARISNKAWDVTAKIKRVDADGNKITELATKTNHGKGIEISFSPKFAEGPAWPVIDRAPQIVLPQSPAIIRAASKYKLAIICSDEQIFFWRDLPSEKWYAGHDERAMDIVLQVVEDFHPDRIIDGGDLVDNPEWSGKFRKFPEFAGGTQRAINRAALWCAQLRQAAPDAEIDEIEGNHDARIRNFIIDNAAAAHNITRAYDQRTPLFREQPSLSMPYLLRLEDHSIRYSAAYPGGDVWLNSGIVFAHENGKIVKEERATLFHGHDHKVHENWITVHHRGKQMRRAVVGVGTLARTDEIIGNLERCMRSHIPASGVRQNWQQGFAIVHYLPNGGPSDFSLQLVQIVDGTANVGGKPYVARKRDLNGNLRVTRQRKVA